MIDFSINIGVIVQTVLILGGGLIALGAIKKTVSNMEKEILEVKKDQRDMSKTIAQIAVQDSRINRLEEDVRDLRHGRGLIINGINGEEK